MPVDTVAGYYPRSSAEHLAIIQGAIEVALNGGAPMDWPGRDKVVGNLAVAVASMLGEIEQGSLATVVSALDRNNAQGALLDMHVEMLGSVRRGATYSTATVTVSGPPGFVVPAGTVFRTDGANPVRFETVADNTLLGGSQVVAVRAVEPGAVQASTNALSYLVGSLPGVTVVASSPAVPGEDYESDDALRIRCLDLLRGYGDKTIGALTNAVRSSARSVSNVRVIENDTDATITVGGQDIPAHHIAVVVYPALSVTEQEQVARAIYGTKALGIGTVGGVTVTLNVDSGPKAVKFYEAAPVVVPVTITASRTSTDFTAAEVETGIQTQIEAAFRRLQPGQEVNYLQLISAIGAVPGVAAATLLIDGVASSYAVGFFDVGVLGALSVTVA